MYDLTADKNVSGATLSQMRQRPLVSETGEQFGYVGEVRKGEESKPLT